MLLTDSLVRIQYLHAVKRWFFSIILLLGIFLVPTAQPARAGVNAPDQCDQIQRISFQLPDDTPHPILNRQVISISSPVYKKIASTVPVPVVVPQPSTNYYSAAQPVVANESSKSYLFHIYPSHHFW
jgi:hypothetical protein